jgi:asparagine synthase (glutamine-hydrolysing)
MAAAMGLRGEGGVREWHAKNVAMAQLSFHFETPAQSLRHEDVALVTQSRLDNRDDLVPTLRRHGVTPQSSDAEVILAAYRHWGTDCAARLIGDFTFAIWDDAEQQLFAARDPMAMRPFYYHLTPERVAFASAIGPLLTLPETPKKLNEAAAAVYLSGPFGRADWTLFEGISQLPPAHTLIVTPSEHRTWRYWEPDLSKTVRLHDDREYAEGFRTYFVRAVKDRLRTASPVGVALSGGVDSSCVAATVGWLDRQDVRAYAWAFANPELATGDERATAQLTTDAYGLTLTPVFGDDAWPLSHLEAHGPELEDPYFWFVQTLNDRVYQNARRDGVGMLMTGDRGDEVVGDWLYDYPGWLRAGRMREVMHDLRCHHLATGESYRSIAKRQFLPPHLTRGGFRPAPAPWVNAELSQRVNLPALLAEQNVPTSPRHARAQRIFGVAAANIIAFTERRMARYGLELAAPWSDRRLAEYILSIPQWRVQSLSQPKRIAKEALRGILPEAALARVAKTTQEPLYDLGIKDKAHAVIADLTENSVAAQYGLLEPAAVRAAHARYLEGKPVQHDYWWALILELWLRRYWT